MNEKEVASKRLGIELGEQGPRLTKDSLLSAIGGIQGLLETILPSTVFLMAFAFSKSTVLAVTIAGSMSLGFILARLLQRKSLIQAVVGALAVGLAAFLALREGGSAVDYFLPGFFTNLAYGLVLALSALVGRPILGYLAGWLFGIPDWRKNLKLRRYFGFVTWIWVGFFSARLLVQVPLYLAGAVEQLATARIIMGAPAYAGLLALTWVLLRRVGSEGSGRLEK